MAAGNRQPSPWGFRLAIVFAIFFVAATIAFNAVGRIDGAPEEFRALSLVLTLGYVFRVIRTYRYVSADAAESKAGYPAWKLLVYAMGGGFGRAALEAEAYRPTGKGLHKDVGTLGAILALMFFLVMLAYVWLVAVPAYKIA